MSNAVHAEIKVNTELLKDLERRAILLISKRFVATGLMSKMEQITAAGRLGLLVREEEDARQAT